MTTTRKTLSRPLIAFTAFALGAAAIAIAQEKAKPAASAGATAARPKATAQAATTVGYKYKTNVKGPADAPIKVVEFADFMCPACQSASGALRSYFDAQGQDINLTFKNFPLEKTCNTAISQSIHNGACELAMGAICASDLGGFWGYHDRIFSRAWEVATRKDVLDNAEAAGMDRAKFDACMNAPATRSKLAIQIKEAIEVDVRQTPTIVVNGKKLQALNQFARVVEEERKKLGGTK